MISEFLNLRCFYLYYVLTVNKFRTYI
jgi:hypothetical protein